MSLQSSASIAPNSVSTIRGGAHKREMPIHDSCDTAEADLITRKMPSFIAAGSKERSRRENLNKPKQLRNTNETKPICNTNAYIRQFYKITSYDPLFDLFLSFLFVESKHGNVDNCPFPFCSNASTQFGYCAPTSRPLFSISHYHHLMSIARLRLCPACVSCPCSAIHHFRISLFRIFFVFSSCVPSFA